MPGGQVSGIRKVLEGQVQLMVNGKRFIVLRIFGKNERRLSTIM